jgi:hypothetical protein
MAPGIDFDSDRIDGQFDPIQRDNDEFRLSRMNVGHDILWPKSMASRGIEFLGRILAAVREDTNFGDWDTLHDYGTVSIECESFEWKILYQDSEGRPVRPEAATRRALAIDSK